MCLNHPHPLHDDEILVLTEAAVTGKWYPAQDPAHRTIQQGHTE